MRCRLPVVLAAFALVPAAQSVAATPHVEASLLAETESIQPGRPVVVGIRLKMEEGWHTYWKNPADSGLPTKHDLDAARGLHRGSAPVAAPRAHRRPAAHELRIRAGGAAARRDRHSRHREAGFRGRRSRAAADWLECREACLPGKAELSLTLPVRAEAPAPGPFARSFAETRGLTARRPRRLEGRRLTRARARSVLSFASSGRSAPRSLLLRVRPAGPGLRRAPAASSGSGDVRCSPSPVIPTDRRI